MLTGEGLLDVPAIHAAMAAYGDPATVNRMMEDWLGVGWQTHPPEYVLETLLRRAGHALAAECYESTMRPAVCATIAGTAVPYDVASMDQRRHSFGPGCFDETTMAVNIRGDIVELRCEHSKALKDLVGRVTRLWDEVTDDGLTVLRFAADLYDTPSGREIGEEIDTRLGSGALVGTSVGVGKSEVGETEVYIRADGGRDFARARLKELTLTDQPAMGPTCRVTDFAWTDKYAVLRGIALMKLRREMVRESREARGIFEHRGCRTTYRGLCDFNDTQPVQSRSPCDEEREREKERLRRSIPIAWKHIWGEERFEQYINDLVENT